MRALPQAPCGTVAILASGPSLAAEDVSYVRGKATVIAVNDAVLLASDPPVHDWKGYDAATSWADVLYSSDPQWWASHKWVKGFAGVRVMVDPIRAHKNYKPPCEDHGVRVLKNTGKQGVEFSPEGLRTQINSGGAAINLAVHLLATHQGVKRVVLLGYDMGPQGKRYHFHDEKKTYSAYEVFIANIGTMAEPLAKAGIQVFNCSRVTKLACFPRMALADAWPEFMAVAS